MIDRQQEALFITLEGVDGAGKSTHIPYIAECLRRRGAADLLVTREPGGTPLAEALRELLLREPMDALEETLLMFAARADHVRRVIRPALAAGRWVLCDRFSDATVAYQGAGKGVEMNLIRSLGEKATQGLRPSLTLLFDCPYEVAKGRLDNARRKLDRFEQEDRDFFERVRERYLELADAEPGRILKVDASGSLESIKKVIENSVLTL